MVERSICIREAPGSIPGFSSMFFARPINWFLVETSVYTPDLMPFASHCRLGCGLSAASQRVQGIVSRLF